MIFTACVRSMTGNVFTGVSLSVHNPSHNTSTGPMSFPEGVPHLHPIILPLVPCPFWGYPSDWLQVPSQEVPQSQVGGTPVLVRGVPHNGVSPSRSGWGTPWLGWGTPQLFMGYPPRIGFAWIGYVTSACCGSAGGLSCWVIFKEETVLFLLLN